MGKRGKRAKIVVKKSSLSLQFSFKDGKGNSQKNVGLGAIPSSKKGIEEAEKIAQLVTGQLMGNTFTWDWFNSLIGKDTSEKSQVLTCKEMVETYKAHYFKQKKGNKNPEGCWYNSYRKLEKTIDNLEKPLSLSLIRKAIDCTENNTAARKKLLSGIANFLKYFDIDDYKPIIEKYKEDNKYKPDSRNVPTDERIMEVQKNGFKLENSGNKRYSYRCFQWQFLYGLLAVYGLRIHEAWHIANWDKPVTLKKGDWVIVDDLQEGEAEQQHQNKERVIPAILDPENKDYILCIKHDTKTGYRMVAPISPKGHNWLKEFNLLQPLNLPDFKDPYKKYSNNESAYVCSHSTTKWFRRRKYGFKPHDLRHAYVIRGHVLNYNPKALADSTGHSMLISTTTYTKHMKLDTKYENLVSASSKKREKDSEIEILKSKNLILKDEVEKLKNENELLRTKLSIESLLAKE